MGTNKKARGSNIEQPSAATHTMAGGECGACGACGARWQYCGGRGQQLTNCEYNWPRRTARRCTGRGDALLGDYTQPASCSLAQGMNVGTHGDTSRGGGEGPRADADVKARPD